MDFLYHFDDKIDIRRQTLETHKGQIVLYNQLSLESKSVISNVNVIEPFDNSKSEKHKAKCVSTISTVHVKVDKDDESDDLYSVISTVLTQVAYRDLPMSPVSSGGNPMIRCQHE